MGRLIDIAWLELGATVTAELADGENPELVEEFWRHLPFRSLAVHPVAGGEIMYTWAPIVSTAPVRKRVPLKGSPIGELRYSPGGGNKLGMQYGVGFEPSVTPLLGQIVPEHVARLRPIGQAVWENLFWKKNKIFMEVRPHTPAEAYAGPGEYDGLSGALADIHAEAMRLLTEEPRDIRFIRSGENGDAGSYGQYFSVWHMAHSRLHDYIVCNLFPMIKLAERLPVDEFKTVFSSLAYATEYMAYLGYRDMHGFSEAMKREVMAAETSAQIILALKVFLLYGYRLCSWSFLYFPWYLGVHFGRTVNGQEFPGRVVEG